MFIRERGLDVINDENVNLSVEQSEASAEITVSDKPKQQRNISGLRPFPKGVSGNPGGIAKPKIGETVEDRIRKKLQGLSEQSILEMSRILSNPKVAPGTKVAAARLILEFSISKPPQAVEGKFEGAMIVLSGQMQDYAQ